jgi:hypothetical protein
MGVPNPASSANIEDDPDHPVPSVNSLDVRCVKKGGGSDLYLVVASPLGGNQRDLERLLQKLENYLAFIQSSQCTAEAGLATPENTRIIAKVHPDSSPLVFELLRRNTSWVANNGASLQLEPLENQTLQ